MLADQSVSCSILSIARAPEDALMDFAFQETKALDYLSGPTHSLGKKRRVLGAP